MAIDLMEERWHPVHNDDGDFIVTETGKYLDELPMEDVLLRVCRDHNRALLLDEICMVLQDNEHLDKRIPDLLARIEAMEKEG